METFIFDEVAFKGPILHFKVKRPISIAGTVYRKSRKILALQHFDFMEKLSSEKSVGTMSPHTIGVKNLVKPKA